MAALVALRGGAAAAAASGSKIIRHGLPTLGFAAPHERRFHASSSNALLLPTARASRQQPHCAERTSSVFRITPPCYTTTRTALCRCMSSSSAASSSSSYNSGHPRKRRGTKKGRHRTTKRLLAQKMMMAKTSREDDDKAAFTRAEEENIGVEDATRAWVKRVVVGLNLCPFAAKPLGDGQLYITVIRGNYLEEILRQILAQALVFTEGDQQLPGTALLVCPDLAPNDFNEYLNVLTMVVDGLLEDHDLLGKVQVVPFHPLFVFAGDENAATGDDTDNSNKMEYWTNRSPYPMFHILKEDDVSRAVELMKGDTDKVWQRNVHLFQRMEEICKEDASSSSVDEPNSNSNNSKRALEHYLQSGLDNKEGTTTSLVKQALDDTSKEFPLLQCPISGDTEDGSGHS